jgi:hypothetical protein
MTPSATPENYTAKLGFLTPVTASADGGNDFAVGGAQNRTDERQLRGSSR